MGGAKAHYDGIVAFSQTDFTEDLKKISVPVLVMHGEDDQIVCLMPIQEHSLVQARAERVALKSYPGFPTGCRPPKPRRSTQICWSSSSAEAGTPSPNASVGRRVGVITSWRRLATILRTQSAGGWS